MTELNHYKILRLKSSATPKEIDIAYRDLSILYRDRNESPSKEVMKLIDEAYFVLQDPARRAGYDIENSVQSTQIVDLTELSEAERVIYAWGQFFTTDEQDYIDKVHAINKIIRFVIYGLAVIFIWSVVTFRWNITFLLMFGATFLRTIVWSIYRIKNPAPPIDLSAIE